MALKCALQVQTYSDDECRRILSSEDSRSDRVSFTGLPSVHPSSRLCAYAPRKDTCQGDSGGPLTLKQDDRYILLGVTSYGRGCAADTAGIYARVQGFLPWIAGIVPGDLACGAAVPTPTPTTSVTNGTTHHHRLSLTG